MEGPRGRPAARQNRPNPAASMLPWAIGIALLLSVSAALLSSTATGATQSPPGGLFIIRKVILNAPGDTTSTLGGTLVKAQGNQLIGTFTLAQGNAVYFPGLANGTYIVTETDPRLVGYWSSPGDRSCPSQPSSDPNPNRGQINTPTDIVTVCVYNQVPAQAGGAPDPVPTPVPTTPAPTPAGSTPEATAAPASTATPWPTPIAPSTGSGEADGSSSSRPSTAIIVVLLLLVLAMPLFGSGRR